MNMDPADWETLALDVIERLKPRLNVKWVGGINSELQGGEYSMAVEDLTGILADDQVPITRADREDLRRLAAAKGKSFDDVERLVVVEDK